MGFSSQDPPVSTYRCSTAPLLALSLPSLQLSPEHPPGEGGKRSIQPVPSSAQGHRHGQWQHSDGQGAAVQDRGWTSHVASDY